MNTAVPSQAEIERLWFTGEPVPRARFYLSDAVGISSGSHAGESGAVIALLVLVPLPRYLVELGGRGHDVECDEPCLTHAA